MSSQRFFVWWLLAVATVSLAVCVSAATTATPNLAFYETDPVGDPTRAGAADITAIYAVSTSTTMRFRITLAKQPPLRAEDGVGVLIDVPPGGPWPNPFSFEGVDYAVGVHGPKRTGLGVTRNAKGSWSFPVAIKGHVVSLSIPRRRIGNPPWLNFVVATTLYSKGGMGATPGVDTAPAWMHGTFFYSFNDIRYPNVTGHAAR